MFDPQDTPRVFATPIGVDFSRAVVAGIAERMAGAPPEALARVEVYVNTARTQRRLREIYAQSGPGFLPRIRLITDLAARADMAGLPAPIPDLRLRLDLSQLVAALLDRQPQLAPRSSLYGLSDALADLMAEMQEERVTPDTVAGLDVEGHSDHWQRAQEFLRIVAPYFAEGDDAALSIEARQSRVADMLAADWAKAPPQHPVIVAGSTGSRGPTARFMAAVAHLPQGAVILPGLDYDQPGAVWDKLTDGLSAEDHPQFRFMKFATGLGLHPLDIARWSTDAPANPPRNRLISLALRPAPVTDQWLAEGPKLEGLAEAASGLTLIEAPTPQAEAAAIALRLRRAAEDGITAALISPDVTLTRQVTAALDRWGIEPDDSSGLPLSHTAPGRLLRHVAEARATRVSAEGLLVLLKHPLTHAGRADRGEHLKRTRDLELQLLRREAPFPSRADLARWAERRKNDAGAVAWALWVSDTVLDLFAPEQQPLQAHVSAHLEAVERLSAGPGGGEPAELWEKEEGRKTRAQMQALTRAAEAGGTLTAAEYRDFLTAILAEEEARDPVSPHPRIMIWGTLEARVQGADLVILGGLNEGSWPSAPGADPWLNRRMRAEAGLRLPDRVIGLAAHDFQQSVGGAEVWLSRARRDAETETVPSRWLNRITNLMEGASDESRTALEGMRERGADWVAMAMRLDEPVETVPAAKRPAPCPPVGQRPGQLSVTDIEKLIRDPYAIYARKVLDLHALNPLRQMPDAPLRGTILHDILRRFTEVTKEGLPEDAEALLLRITEEMLEDGAPWPAARRIWLARIARVAPWFIETERARRALGQPVLLEEKRQTRFEALDFTLTAKPDRVDVTPDGRVILYDYKTGGVPTKEQEAHYNKQLWLEALMARQGAFDDHRDVARISYIGLGSGGKITEAEVSTAELDEVAQGFARLITHFADPGSGYPSRRAMEKLAYSGDFDHLARHGEWDETMEPVKAKVGE